VDAIVNARKAAPEGPVPFQAVKDWIGQVTSDAAVRALEAAGDIALVVDRDGVIKDVAVGAKELATEGFSSLRRRKWVDTVAADSRAKVVEMLADAGRAASAAAPSGRPAAPARRTRTSGVDAPSPNGGIAVRWREVNQQTAQGGLVPIRFCALSAGEGGNIVALGRDLRGAAALQQRLLQVEQTMERDYTRLRHAETRYRTLFHSVSEAVVIVDAASRRIVEANPAAGQLFGVDHAALIGKPVSWFVGMDSQEAVATALMRAGQPGRAEPTAVTLAEGRGQVRLTVSVFRQDRVTHLLLRLQAVSAAANAHSAQSNSAAVMERIPDPFFVTSEDLTVLDANAAFLDLVQAPDIAAAVGAPLSRFIGRSAVDVSVLVQSLREHGWVRNFSTVARTPFDGLESVDISGVSAPTDAGKVFGFTLRPAARAEAASHRDLDALPRSVEQLTDLIGRVPLKEIVRETTDIIERLCIQAALKLTGDNRASAAELLGLSRQSLYSKLHRFDLAGAGEGE
jgi:transcriptional regulator PpsR